MADPGQTLQFLAWVRDSVNALATGQAGGRANARATVTLSAKDAAGGMSGSQARDVSFLLAGPADVVGFTGRAIVRRYPAPGSLDHESDRCPYVELADPSLPWRYTPAATPADTDARLHPWFVLVVGEEGSELTLADGQVTIEPGVQVAEHALGPPMSAQRFAHVQEDATGHRTARVLCGRPLLPGTDYVAVLVPAYDASGARSWTGDGPVTVPAYDSWRFRTATPAGSFEDLAARLRPGDAPATAGRAPLHYPRLDGAPELDVLGALVAFRRDEEPTDGPLPDEIAADLTGLQLPARDEQDRPIVALPRYGDAWSLTASNDARWGRQLNRDPRRRGVAGLGLEVGIRFQEDLVSDVLAHLGALHEARQRMRNAVLGVTVARSLWRRRVPSDDAERLWFLGPSLARLATETGTVGAQATADDRTMARGTFSAAARRVLRAGPARTTIAATAVSPSDALTAANQPPPPPPATVDGIPLDRRAFATFDGERRRTIDLGHVDADRLLAAANDVVAGTDDRLKPIAGQMVTAMRLAAQEGRAVPWGQALATLAASDADIVRRGRRPVQTMEELGRELSSLRDRFDQRADDADLTGLLADLDPMSANDPPLRHLDLDALATGVAAAFDPTTDRPPIIDRVLDTINGVDAPDPLVPPEPCVGLDRAVWADVERAFDEWLLPGIGQVPDNAVISLQTNPVFVDALLAGLNTQLLSELRWRNIPVVTGCTLIKRFWDRTDSASGDRVDDIVGLQSWVTTSALGDVTHRPQGATGKDLVIAVRGNLFLRYPATLVYLKSAVQGSPPAVDFDADPLDDSARLLPGFQGRLGGDIAFFGFPGFDPDDIATHWLVFEEPPAGYRFANDSSTTATDGHAWAAAALVSPVRVLIRGDAMIPGGSG